MSEVKPNKPHEMFLNEVKKRIEKSYNGVVFIMVSAVLLKKLFSTHSDLDVNTFPSQHHSSNSAIQQLYTYSVMGVIKKSPSKFKNGY